MNHQGTAVIQTPVLTLRPFTAADAEPTFHNWANDPQVTPYLSWQPHGDLSVTRQVLADWIAQYERPDFYQWAIVPAEVGEPIGSISVVEMDEKTQTVQIGYCIGSRWWHHGFTSQALSALLPFFFELVQAGRLEALHDPENSNSGGVMRKCGLTYEGTLRKACRSNRGITDACIYSMIADDYFRA